MSDSHTTLMQDIPVVPEVSLISLMDAVLPPLPPGELDSVYKTLVAASHIKSPYTNKARWTCLPQDPRTSHQREDKSFKFLEKIAEAIQESHLLESHEWVELDVTGQITPVSFRHDTSRPDGFIYFERPRSGPLGWVDIILTMEFKNKYGEKMSIDNFAKVIWAMHHIMRADARRRHVYGLTCENTTARFWFNDRSDVVVSTEFDVNKDWKALVRIILSILLASPDQLGFDPTIVANTHDDKNSEPSYDITIHNSDTGAARQYRTIRMLSDVGADNPVGRATRVWEVQEIVDDVLVGKPLALKDVWVHDNRTPEHEVLIKIRRDQPDYAQHFLTPRNYGYVPHDPSDPAVPGNTHKTLRRGELTTTGKVLHTYPLLKLRTTGTTSRKTKTSSRDSVGHPEGVPQSCWKEDHNGIYLSKHPRVHYRILFEEIGEPVHELRNFTDIFTAIRGGWEGLHAIHLNKSVHRDVSSGNILLVPASGVLVQRGVISDLEYSKEVDDISAPRDVRTGTATFMATEVACMEHHRLCTLREDLRRRTSSSEIPEQQELAILEQLGEQDASTVANLNLASASAPDLLPPLSPLPPFRHNPLHDMESIWWLCIWMVFYLVPSAAAGTEYFDTYQKVFFDPMTKRDFLCHSAIFLRLTTHLSDSEPFVRILKFWQDRLNQLYFDSYMAYINSPEPLTRIQIDKKTLQSGYNTGKRVLRSLEGASRPMSTQFVTLSQRYHELKQNVPPKPASPKPKMVFDGVHIPLFKRRRIGD